MKVRSCELCNAESSVFCPSDAAFLCWSCDARVHEANFLVARHLRRTICSNCRSFTGEFISGVGFRPSAVVCSSCPPVSDDVLGSPSASSTSSSVCISSTTTPAKEYSGGMRSDSSSSFKSVKRRMSSRSEVNNLKAEGIFVNWCCKLGVESGSSVEVARRALKICVERWSGLPFRVCLAASIWLGLRLSLDKSALTLKVLKRLEEISGVPAKIILAAESKLERAVRRREVHHRRPLELEEGWAEC